MSSELHMFITHFDFISKWIFLQPLVVEREFENPKAPYESSIFMGYWIIIRKYNVYLLTINQCLSF